MVFKRFSLQRKEPEFCYSCEKEILKSNFFSKNKNFRNAVLKYTYWSWLFYSYYITI